MKLLVATGNKHKLEEIRNILQPRGMEVVSPADVGGLEDVEETGSTFAANAAIKAEAAAVATGLFCIADDSGLEVFALNGEPGVRSARYAGPGATDLQKIEKLLGKLQGQPKRTARFVCAIALAGPKGLVGSVEGEVRGVIRDAPRGKGGFGYDPIFQPDGFDQTFGELHQAVKDRISHRANALDLLVSSGLLERMSALT